MADYTVDTAPVWLDDPDYHTAGGQRYVTIRDVNGSPRALVLCDEDEEAEDLRAARQFAAASVMLGALKDMEEARRRGYDLPFGTVRTVIAQAEGRL